MASSVFYNNNFWPVADQVVTEERPDHIKLNQEGIKKLQPNVSLQRDADASAYVRD